MNFGYILSNAAAKYPDKTAIVADEGRYRFADLEERCGRLSDSMLKAGLGPGDRVGLLYYNCAQLVETYLAAVRIGLVATPLNYRLSGRELTYILNNSGARALFFGDEFGQTIAGIADRIESLALMVSSSAAEIPGCIVYEDFFSQGSWVDWNSDIDETHPCQIMYTSGTTGLPKGAVLTHGNIIWNLVNTMHGREDRAQQVSIIVGPLYHSAALNNHLTVQLALGGTSVLVRKFEPELLCQLIEKEKVTCISGSPAMYHFLMQHPSASKYDVRTITKCTVGADKLALETKKRLLEFFPNINGVYDVYGCSEVSPSITILGAMESLDKHGSVGRPVPFLQVRVVDDQDRTLPAGQVGEVVCKGPSVMKCYHGNESETAKALRGGWFHTGDLAYVDDEGFFYVVDRKKDMILSGGENIYSREVEEVILEHEAVADSAVVGAPDPDWGEKVIAFVVLKPNRTLNQAELIEFCRGKLASYKKPKQVMFVSEIPRNPSGKALKKDLRRMIKRDSG